ncbi:hypothetical protein NXV44_00130 [Bacteroides thetaiotaomicron]|nr:hypothetical protein [Bacteroides thetaiotaomicron]
MLIFGSGVHFGAATTLVLVEENAVWTLWMLEDIAFLFLKDATATALYGVRGANGIVLIDDKRGTESGPEINARVGNTVLPIRYVCPNWLIRNNGSIIIMILLWNHPDAWLYNLKKKQNT